MGNKYTPGPWSAMDVRIHDNWDSIPIFSDRHGAIVAECRGTKNSMVDWLASINSLRANANLIAAAPELLEALEGALEVLEQVWYGESHYTSSAHIAVIKSIIAKAKGETK